MATPATYNSGTYVFGYGSGATFGQTGRVNKEDWWAAITNISPAEQPFLAAAPRDPAASERPFWVRDRLKALDVTTATVGQQNAAIEGDDFDFAAYGSVSARIPVFNICQIFREDIAVPDTQQAIAAAGGTVGLADEYEYQATKAAKELLNDIESRMLYEVQAAASGGTAAGASATARRMAVFAATGHWGAIPVVSVSAVTAQGNLQTSGTAVLNALHELVYTEGGRPDTLYVSPGVKADFSSNAQGSGTSRVHNIAAADYRVITVVNVFDGDFGMLRIVPSRQIRQGTLTADAYKAFLVERQRARVGVLRPLKHTPLPKNGDATRGFVLTELTLKIMHPSAHGLLNHLTT
jgi:hypothetical protein